MGETITEADVRLFTTLARFDAVYHGHFKCNRKKLTEMPHLWGYARDLFQTPGFGDTTDFDQIKAHYYRVHTDINPTGVVPKGPDPALWLTPHGRAERPGAAGRSAALQGRAEQVQRRRELLGAEDRDVVLLACLRRGAGHRRSGESPRAVRLARSTRSSRGDQSPADLPGDLRSAEHGDVLSTWYVSAPPVRCYPGTPGRPWRPGPRLVLADHAEGRSVVPGGWQRSNNGRGAARLARHPDAGVGHLLSKAPGRRSVDPLAASAPCCLVACSMSYAGSSAAPCRVTRSHVRGTVSRCTATCRWLLAVIPGVVIWTPGATAAASRGPLRRADPARAFWLPATTGCARSRRRGSPSTTYGRRLLAVPGVTACTTCRQAIRGVPVAPTT